MATDPQTEAYRRSSIAVAGAAAMYASHATSTIDLARLLPSLEEYIELVLRTSTAASARIVSLARTDFYETRLAAGIRGEEPTWQPRPLVDEALRRSLYATVGQTLQGIERHDVSAAAAMKRARVQAQGVVVRQVMNAGRNSTIATTQRDPRALGALYVTREDDRVCSWCLMLASRGPVFGSDSFKDADKLFTGVGTAKSHDACRCVLKTVYSTGSPLLDRAHELEREWRDVNWSEGWRDNPQVATIRNSGKKALNAWRRHVNEQRKAGNPLFGAAT